MKVLKPVILKQTYWRLIESRILSFLNDLIFSEIITVLEDKEKFNSKDNFKDLIEAIKRGKVQYSDGKFTGSFNSKISKNIIEFGGKYKNKAWHIPQRKLHPEVLHAIAQANIKFQAIHAAIIKKLENINLDEKLKTLKFNPTYEKNIDDLDVQFYNTLKGISLDEVLTPTAKEKIAENYSENLKLYIKTFTEDQIIKLRKEVQENAYAGYRAKNLVKVIQARYEVTKSKAKFLARQETALLVSQYREQRYKEAGINEYTWRTGKDDRVRDDHKELDGKIFRWDSPPVVNRKTGRRAHPGEDYGCRCLALPVIR